MNDTLRELFSLSEDLKVLNDKYYGLSGDYNENKEFLPETLAKTIEKSLFDSYSMAKGTILQRMKIASETEMYALTTKADIIVPRKWRCWWKFFRIQRNTAAKLVEGKMIGESDVYFSELMERIDTLRDAVERFRQEQRSAQEGTEGSPAGEDAETPEEDLSVSEDLEDDEIPAEIPEEDEESAGDEGAGEAPQTAAETPEVPSEAWEEEDHDIISDEGVASPS